MHLIIFDSKHFQPYFGHRQRESLEQTCEEQWNYRAYLGIGSIILLSFVGLF